MEVCPGLNLERAEYPGEYRPVSDGFREFEMFIRTPASRRLLVLQLHALFVSFLWHRQWWYGQNAHLAITEPRTHASLVLRAC